MIIDDDGWLDQAVQVESPHRGGPITPLLVVNHWTAGFSASGSIKSLEVQGLSAHFVIGRDGSIIQTVSCNRRAHHAGKSTWRGRAGVNGFSVGIEWANLGPVKSDNGAFVAYGKEITGEAQFIDGQFWEMLTGDQLNAGHRLHRALAERYPTIVEAVDHATVSPGRKIDMIPWQSQIAHWSRVFTAPADALPETPRPVKEREGHHVRAIQAALHRAGFHLAIDGIIGRKTTSAIIEFQKQRGLLHVGVVNHETAEALGLREGD